MATEQEMHAYYLGCLGYARFKGYKEGWAAYRYREAFPDGPYFPLPDKLPAKRSTMPSVHVSTGKPARRQVHKKTTPAKPAPKPSGKRAPAKPPTKPAPPVISPDVARALLLLGLRWPTSLAEVRAAYHKAAHKHHPDRGGDVHQMTRINTAFNLLKSCPGIS